jgi:hypothetical protein
MDIAACFAFASRGVIDLIGFIIDIPSETHPGTRPLPLALRSGTLVWGSLPNRSSLWPFSRMMSVEGENPACRMPWPTLCALAVGLGG